MEWMAAAIVLICFGIGAYFEKFTDKVDAPAEQIAETVLEKYDIKKDFSANKKKKLEDAKNKEVK